MRIVPNIDHTAEIAVGVVVVVALLFLKAVSKTLTPECPLLVELAMTFVEIFYWMLLVQLDGDGHRWRKRRSRWILIGGSLGFCDFRRSSFHIVGKVNVEIIKIVVIKVKTLRGITLRFFGDMNHEDFMAKVLNFLVLFV